MAIETMESLTVSSEQFEQIRKFSAMDSPLK
jgi:hypothetical protein